MENWRIIEGTNGNYSVSNFGDNNLKQQVLENKEFLILLIMKTFSKEDLQLVVDSYKTSGEK